MDDVGAAANSPDAGLSLLGGLASITTQPASLTSPVPLTAYNHITGNGVGVAIATALPAGKLSYNDLTGNLGSGIAVTGNPVLSVTSVDNTIAGGAFGSVPTVTNSPGSLSQAAQPATPPGPYYGYVNFGSTGAGLNLDGNWFGIGGQFTRRHFPAAYAAPSRGCAANTRQPHMYDSRHDGCRVHGHRGQLAEWHEHRHLDQLAGERASGDVASRHGNQRDGHGPSDGRPGAQCTGYYTGDVLGVQWGHAAGHCHRGDERWDGHGDGELHDTQQQAWSTLPLALVATAPDRGVADDVSDLRVSPSPATNTPVPPTSTATATATSTATATATNTPVPSTSTATGTSTATNTATVTATATSTPTGPVSGTHSGTIASVGGSDSYTFTPGTSGATVVGECAVDTGNRYSLYVYDSNHTLLGSGTNSSYCNWAGVTVTAGQTYTVTTVSVAHSGDYRSSWSVGGALVIWKPFGTLETTGTSKTFSFPTLAGGQIAISACGPNGTIYYASLLDANGNTLASRERAVELSGTELLPVGTRLIPPAGDGGERAPAPGPPLSPHTDPRERNGAGTLRCVPAPFLWVHVSNQTRLPPDQL